MPVRKKNAGPRKPPASGSARKFAREKGVVTYDPLRAYLIEVNRYDLLTREEEHDLAVRLKEEGSLEAAQRLVTGNLRLVIKIAGEYQKYWMNLLDLIQEGNVGLMHAVKNFDPYRGVKLSSYASFWIKAYILKFVLDNWSLVKIGTTQAQRKLFYNLKKEKEKYTQQGFLPEPKMIASDLGVEEREVIEMSQRLEGGELSLDAPIGGDTDDTHMSMLRDTSPPIDEVLAENELRQMLDLKLADFRLKLKDKELFIYDRRLIPSEPLTLQEIGEQYGISRERVRQLENRVKRKLKAFLTREMTQLPHIDIDLATEEENGGE